MPKRGVGRAVGCRGAVPLRSPRWLPVLGSVPAPWFECLPVGYDPTGSGNRPGTRNSGSDRNTAIGPSGGASDNGDHAPLIPPAGPESEPDSIPVREIDEGTRRTPLLCLPFAGSGAGFYRAWRRLAVGPVEVVPLQLPGREERFTEALPSDLITAARELARDWVRVGAGRGPVALFGHSLGAVLGYEVAREIDRTHPGLVCHLFVSGSPAPWIVRVRRATDLDDDGEFLARVKEFAGYHHEAFDDPQLREVLLPVLRADVAMHENYQPISEEPIDIPITALRGGDDRLVSRVQVEQWRAATTARFAVAELPGGHMYISDGPSALLELVDRTLHERADGRAGACN
jgi:surfactin synthase thioesterase subunit